MRTLALVVLLLALPLLLDSSQVANANAFNAVRYEWSADSGELTLVGAPGSPFAASTSTGDLVASGHLSGEAMSIAVPNTGIGPDGAVLHVGLGGTVFSVTDPEWAWE